MGPGSYVHVRTSSQHRTLHFFCFSSQRIGEQGPQPAHALAQAAGPALSTQTVGWRLFERGQKAGQAGRDVGWANHGEARPLEGC